MRDLLIACLMSLLIATVAALAMGAVYAFNYAHDCDRDGGTFHMSATMLTCSY